MAPPENATSSMSELDSDLMDDIMEAFAIFDRRGHGAITTRQLQEALRSLGQNPSQMQLRNMINGVDPEGTGFINFEDFLGIAGPLVSARPSADIKGDLLETFKRKDPKSTGTVETSELRRAAAVTGHPGLVTPEVTDMLLEADNSCTGEIKYGEFVERIVGQR
eukprot:gnl/MRDRNA2_/MRDRNA2_105357_c0_seq1.p1 gnl/MRDRNA2_/MRDRNA2_105357_c0~~gnl/MRDRNA2_/MRDRNA2_105357_c0_seq1.p1  ORF type:complete len:164 (+),score=38.36 gnl/MRDRNA2_/MRDRNA2_105357_c0_seq1:51-542(+)